MARGSLSLTFPLLFSGLTNAVNQGYLPLSIQEVPYSTGFLITLDENEKIPGYGDCTQGDEPITPFCSGGLISEGVFLTAAHCFENGKGDAASDGSLDLSNLRVGLGALYPYRKNDGSCSGNLLGVDDGIYKVKAVFIHKGFTVIHNEYDYLNPKTGRRAEGEMGLDHMDIAVVYLDECTTPISGNKPRHGKIAGAIYPSLSQMWAPEAAGSLTNTVGMPASFWGYGESEDDRMYDPQNPGQLLPKAVRRGDWNLNRATTSFTTTGSDNVEKIWSNCDWLEDDAPVWNSGTDSATSGYSGGNGSFPNKVKASPFLACTLRNPNDPNVKSLCKDQTSRNACTASKSMLGKSFCKWKNNACKIDEDTVGGIGLVTYPSSGGGDSGAAAWHLQQDSEIKDRDQLELVHVGIVYAASVLYPAWDQAVRTDYFQNWLAQVIDRDVCAAFKTKEYFVGFDHHPFTRAPQAQWDNLSQYYVGKVKGVKGAQALSRLPKRGNAGDWATDNENDEEEDEDDDEEDNEEEDENDEEDEDEDDCEEPEKITIGKKKKSCAWFIKRKSCDNKAVATKCPKSCGKCGNDDENEDEEDDSNVVFCPELPAHDYCDCKKDCVENPSFCACDKAQKCCEVDDEDEDDEEESDDEENDEEEEEECEDTDGKVKIGKFNKTCKWYKEKKKCKNKKLAEALAEACPKSCGKCGGGSGDDDNDEEGCPPDAKPNKKFWTGKTKNGKPEMKKCNWLEKQKDKGKNIKTFCKVDSEDSGLSTAKEACTGTCETCNA